MKLMKYSAAALCSEPLGTHMPSTQMLLPSMGTT